MKPLPANIKPTAKNRIGWQHLQQHAARFPAHLLWLPKSGNVIGGLGTVASFTNQDASRAACAALELKEDPNP